MQPIDLCVDLREVLADELLGVTARALAAIHDLEVAHLPEPEADCFVHRG